MSSRARIGVFVIGIAGLAAAYLIALHGIPAAGHYRGPYGDLINVLGPQQRNITDTVSGVNFDFRGIDTIGEEFVLFVAVSGITLVLRRTGRDPRRTNRSENACADTQPGLPPTSDAVRIAALVSVGPVVALGIYIVAHGHLSPGGGFQGGVILASALLLVYLAGQYRLMRRIGPVSLAEFGEAVGAGGFVLVGVAAVAAGAVFLTNVLPLGTEGYLPSGGTIPVINALVGLEVAGGTVVIISEFLEQALELRGRGKTT